MTRAYLIRIRNFVILVLLQILIFSNIHLYGYATAYLYLLFLLKLPRHTTRNELLLWGFLAGFIVDIFGNTPGINTAAATFMAFTRNYILASFTKKDEADDYIPAASTIGTSGYIGYSLTCIIIFYIALYLLELFTINYPVTLLISVTASSLLTELFILVIECFNRK